MIIKSMILVMIFSVLPNIADAKQNVNVVDQINEVETNLSDKSTEGLKEFVSENGNNEIVALNELNTEDYYIKTETTLNPENENITVNGIIDHDNDRQTVNFNVDLIAFDEKNDIFIANFTDVKTGEVYKYDSTELQASVLPLVPVVVAFIARQGVQAAIKHFGKNTLKEIAKKIPKSESPVWKSFKNHKGKTKTKGSGKNKKYYEWDNTHNDIEVYDHKGKHLGSMDPLTGEMYKGPVKGRTIDI
ncbi:SAR2788 family putative toxin [Bacillus pumilus]|nr:SAR2788 family putative toxin [Bacillus pumilus]